MNAADRFSPLWICIAATFGGLLTACIVTHIAAVMIGDVIFWTTGPVAFGEFSNLDRLAAAAVGLVALMLSVYFSRRITHHASRARPATAGATPPPSSI